MNPLTIIPLYIGFWEILLIVLVILLLVGGKKIPELMKGLGKGTKSFKEGLNEPEDQENQAEKK
ncbi:MAG: twin-arginine translocase TatA/TatE family subunit [Bacteroidales bacterium]|nr:twin-arginine translocase TatA/TatE family subunit [Bacteroidales bacterium]